MAYPLEKMHSGSYRKYEELMIHKKGLKIKALRFFIKYVFFYFYYKTLFLSNR